jgi:peptidoglycan/LPS O-acetylase OafA/YrhL
MHSEYRQDIQALRGIFVVSVVLFHFFPSSFPSGYLGVDGFFVVSGYVLAPQLLKIFSSQKPILNYIKFIKRRFWRLYPAFLVSIVVSLVILFFFISPIVHERSLLQILYSLVNIGDFGAFRFSGDYFDQSQNPFVHFWSLSVEWQFYLAFPLLTVFILSFLREFNQPMFSRYLVGVTLLSFMVWILQDTLEQVLVTLGLSEYSSGLGYYIGIGRFWQFLLGLAAFEMTRQCKIISKKYVNIFSSVILITILLWRNPHEIFGSIYITLFTLLLLVFTPKSVSLFKWFRTERFFVFIGKISYSVYLIHFPFAVACNENLPFFHLSPREDAGIRIFICFVIVIISYFIFVNVENRYRLTNSSPSSVFTSKVYLLTISFVLTLGIFYLGMSSSYFGLEKSSQKPPLQTHIGQNCSGNSINAIPCIGNRNGKNGAVVLLGDSHAEHFSKTFFESAKSLDLKYYGIGFCAPSLKSYADQREGCLKFSENAKSEIEKIRPRILVISVLISNDEMLHSVLDYISEVHGVVSQVVVLTNSPYFLEPIFVSRPIVYRTEEFTKGSFESDMNLEFRRLAIDFASEVRRLGIKTIDLWPLFCVESYCSRFDQGNWLFTDQHHLSSFGAARLEPLFLELLGNKSVGLVP